MYEPWQINHHKSMPRNPSISIILPTYNRCDLLSRSIASVLNQSYPDFELIIIDDASTDDTWTFLGDIKDPRIVLHRQEVNRGQSVARNIGIGIARGDLIAFQDSDDEWLPDKLSQQVDVISSEPKTVMVYGDLLRVPKQGAPFVITSPTLVKGRLFDERKSGYASYGIGVQTCLFRTGVLRKLGGFDEQLRCFEDLELFLRITRSHATRKLTGPVARYHETGGVCATPTTHYAARKTLLRRYWPWALAQKPTWILRELHNIRHRISLAA